MLAASSMFRNVDSLQSRAVHTPGSTAALSGASAVFRGFRPAEGATTARARGDLSLIPTVRQQVLRVRRDPDVGQERTRATVSP